MEQLTSQSPRDQQHLPDRRFLQNVFIALWLRRTWLITVVSIIFLALLCGSVFFVLKVFLPLISLIILGACIVEIGVFVSTILLAKRQAINAYRKAVRNKLKASMSGYYPPEGAPELEEGQGQHLLVLGLPGSGKTSGLEYFLYKATEVVWDRSTRIPILIQMKYYNGFFRHYQPDHSLSNTMNFSAKTLIAYLMDRKYEGANTRGQHFLAMKESELPGLQHLRPYLQQLIAQGRIVFLCDGMNELESSALQIVHDELILVMQTPNRVIMTCRELEYQEQALLPDFVQQGAIPKMLPALSESDVPHIVESYFRSKQQPGGGSRKAALSNEQIERKKEHVLRINQPHRYTSPFMLIMLLEILDQLTPQQAQIISRGRLLQLSVEQRLTSEDASAVLQFLSVVACTARRNQQRNAIQLGSNKKPISPTGFAEHLNDWLSENDADEKHYIPSDSTRFLALAQNTGLITLSNYGVLSFMHELIAEYFTSEYLSYIYHEHRNRASFWKSLYDSESQAPGIWSEPVALWAGLESEPMYIATFLIEWVKNYNRQYGENIEMRYHALSLSLACVGISPPAQLPQVIREDLKLFVRSAEERAKLAKIFKRCADEGGVEVYDALLPLIDEIPGLSDLLLELHELHSKSDDIAILTLLLGYLKTIALQPTYSSQALVSLLGELGKRKFGSKVRSDARAILCEDPASTALPLRIAAINILRLIKNTKDVQIIANRLYDEDNEQRIAGAAISALIDFGPELTIDTLNALEKQLRHKKYAQTRMNLLLVLEQFLRQEVPQAPLSITLYQRIIVLVISTLSAFDHADTWKIAQRLLHEILQQNPQRREIVTLSLLNALLSEQGQARRIQVLLQANCKAIFPFIVNYWTLQAPPIQIRVRIIEMLGEVTDDSIVSPIILFLLQQLDESASDVQEALSHSLSLHHVASISPLLSVLLEPNTTKRASRVAANALKAIGSDSVIPIYKELLNSIGLRTNVSEAGLFSLVELLDYFRGNALLRNEHENVIDALNVLLEWLVNTIRYIPLSVYVIQVLTEFHHIRVVPLLISLLKRSEKPLDAVSQQAIISLSSLGDISFPSLVDALDNHQETLTTKRVFQILHDIKPFPYERLLSTFKDSRQAVVQQVEEVFIANQSDPQAVSFLVDHLNSTENPAISSHCMSTIKAMHPKLTMPWLVKALKNTGWQIYIEPLLLDCPEPTIVFPLLVAVLDDTQYRIPARDLLLKFDPSLVLPWLIPGLENPRASLYTRTLITQMLSLSQQQKIDLVPYIVRLFNPANVQPPLSELSLEARTALYELLTNELSDISLSALIEGLREPKLVKDCSLLLVTLANLPGRKGEVIDAVLRALRNKSQRPGARTTLIQAGQLAVDDVGALLWNTNDNDLKEEALSILAELGEITFPIIYRLAHDAQHLSDANAIFMRMPTPTVAQALLSFLASNDSQQIEIAQYLLSMSLDRDQRSGRFTLTTALLQLALKQQSRNVRLRVLTALLFFNTDTQQRKKIAELILDAVQGAIKNTSEEYHEEYHTEFIRSLLLLGNQAEEPLVRAIDTSPAFSNVQLEAVGTLSTLSAHPYTLRYVESLAGMKPFYQKTDFVDNRTRDLRQQELGFRALGGLLASGIYAHDELINLQNTSKSNKDLASFEFYQVLLGTRNMPHIAQLNKTIGQLNADNENLEKQVNHQKRRAENAEARARISEQYAKTLEDRAVAAEQALNNLRRSLPPRS